MRDIRRKIQGDEALQAVFAHPLSLSWRVLTQKKRQEAPKVYALHAPEVECIGKGKAHKPYEFGVKVSLATTVSASKGGQFILHAKALPGNPYDGHTLKTILPGIEAMTGAACPASLPTPDTRATPPRRNTSSRSTRKDKNAA